MTDDDDNVYGPALVGPGGVWTVLLPGLADGPHTVTAVQTDAAGNASLAERAASFTVDASAPPAPVILVPADGSTTGDSTPTITGTGEAGDTLTVTIDGDAVAAVLVGAGGDLDAAARRRARRRAAHGHGRPGRRRRPVLGAVQPDDVHGGHRCPGRPGDLHAGGRHDDQQPDPHHRGDR